MRRHFREFFHASRQWVAAFGVAGAVFVFGSAAASPITNIAQLLQLTESGGRHEGVLQIEGVVWWSNVSEGRVILADDSGAAQLELDQPCEIPSQETRVRLEGNCVLERTKDAIKLSSFTLVDNDGLHGAVEKSRKLHLNAGRHPIRVAWFNRTDRYELEIGYEGPGLARQRIPDAVLFHIQRDSATGAASFVNGLDYRCCEGLWWNQLPNLDHLPAVKSGIAPNFELGVKSRNEHVGLQFSGFIEIAQEGDYTFYTRSDDGSRLFIGEPSLQVRSVGRSALPMPRAAVVGQAANEDDYEWSEIEGVVTSVNRLQDDLEIELATASGRARLKVADNSECSFSLVPQSRIRAVGVRRQTFRLDGGRAQTDLFVQRWEDIDQSYVAPELWTMYPQVTVSNALTMSLPAQVPVIILLRGKIVSGGADHQAWLDDGAERIAVELVNPDGSGQSAYDLLGRLAVVGTNRILRCGFLRRVGEVSSGASNALPVLTTVEQVHQMRPDELKRGYPVKLRGVVTTVLPNDAITFQDATRGIYVLFGTPNPLRPGDFCEVEGVTSPGEFSPFIRALKFTELGEGQLPIPVQPTWDQLLNGSLHCQYVELEGVVTEMNGTITTLLTRGGRIKVETEFLAPPLPEKCRNALVRLRGCLFTSWDTQTRRVVVGRVFLNQTWVSVVQPAPVDPFALPTKTVDDLLRFDPQAGALQRVKVSGQIIYEGKETCFLMDGDSGLRFVPAGKLAEHVCDLVEVVGFPDLSGPAPVLREAVVRRVGLAELHKAKRLDADALVRDEHDSTLVQVEGVLVALTRKPEGSVLELQSGLRRFVVTIKTDEGFPKSLASGSRLELTGVYVGEGGNRALGRPIDSFQLLLNSGFDVRVLSRPPWWTLTRMLSVVGMLAGVLVIALIWIKLLHRKVDERTRQLKMQIQQRQSAERQRAVEQERARVAHDLHDDLGAGLTEVNMLTALVKSPMTSTDEKARYMDDLSQLAGRMVNSLDEIVWAMSPRNDTLASLASYFGSYAQRWLELASVRCGLDVAEDLPDFQLDTKFRQELFLAFKEALSNVARHAGATKVWLRIFVWDGALVVELTDDGRGFETGKPPAGADGLANMRERLAALGGGCDIQSELGKGTTVRFRAPLPKSLL